MLSVLIKKKNLQNNANNNGINTVYIILLPLIGILSVSNYNINCIFRHVVFEVLHKCTEKCLNYQNCLYYLVYLCSLSFNIGIRFQLIS